MHAKYPMFDEMLSHIDRLLSLERDDDELWTVYSYIDNYAKDLSTKEGSGPRLEQLFEICKKYGFIPQYNVSGPAVFFPKGTILNNNAKFLITPERGGIMISASGEMRPMVFLFHSESDAVAKVDLSPETNYLAIIYQIDGANRLIVWDLTDLKIVIRCETPIVDFYWGNDETLYYVDKTMCLIKQKIVTRNTTYIHQLDPDTRRICINEKHSLYLWLGKKYIRIYAPYDEGRLSTFYETFSQDAILAPAPYGFRIFSGSQLFAVDDVVYRIWSTDKSCKIRCRKEESHLNTLERDSGGVYTDNAPYKYYFDKHGEINKIVSGESKHIFDMETGNAIGHIRCLLPDNRIENTDRTINYASYNPAKIVKRIKDEGTLAFINWQGHLTVAKYMGEARRNQPLIDAVIFEGYTFYNIPAGTYVRLYGIILDAIDFEFDTEPEPDTFQLKLGILSRIKTTDDLMPIVKLVFGNISYNNIAIAQDGSHITFCSTLHESGKTIIITDSEKCKIVDGKLISEYNRVSKEPLLSNDGHLSRVCADGSIVRIPIENARYVLCYGEGILYQAGNQWNLNDQDVTAIVGKNSRIGLVSKDTMVILTDFGWISYHQNDPAPKTHYRDSIGYWKVLGKSDTGYLCMCHYELQGNTVEARFAELDSQKGYWKELEGTIKFDVPVYAESEFGRSLFSIFDYVDFRKQTIIQVDRTGYRSYINRYKLTSGEIIRSNNAIRTNITKKWLRPIGLPNNRYVLMTTEEDNEDHKSKQERPEVRIMDALTGTRIKGIKRSGGIMYGTPGHYLRDDICRIILSPEQDFLFVHYENGSGIQSFDLVNQKTYPENESLKGIILGIIEPGKLMVCIPDEKGRMSLRREYDYRLRPLTDPETMITEQNPVIDGIAYELPEELVDHKYRVLAPRAHCRISPYYNTLVLVDATTEPSTPTTIYLGHFKFGRLDNIIPYSLELPDDIEDGLTIERIEDCINDELYVISSSEIMAVLDRRTVNKNKFTETCNVTLYYGTESKTIEIQNPLDMEGEIYCEPCPVWVSGNNYAFSRETEGKTSVELHKIDRDGTDLLLKSIQVDRYCAPIYADDSLLLLLTDDHKLIYSYDWKNVISQDVPDISHIVGSLELIAKEYGTYTFFCGPNKMKFENGQLTNCNHDSDMHVLEMETGTLKWNYGIVILEI